VSAPEVREGAPVVADTAVGAAERAEEIGALAGVPFDVGEDRQRLFRLPSPRQHGRETDAGVDVGGMLPEYRAKPGFRVGETSQARFETRHPQARLDVGRVLLDQPHEDLHRLDGLPRPRQLLGAAAIGGGRLRSRGQDERGCEREQHACRSLLRQTSRTDRAPPRRIRHGISSSRAPRADDSFRKSRATTIAGA